MSDRPSLRGGRRPDVRPVRRSSFVACPRRPRVLLIGEAPSRTSDPLRPLSGRCGEALAELAGVSTSDFRRRFALANVLSRWPGSSGAKGTAWRLVRARLEAARLAGRFVPGRTVVLLGKRTALAFGVRAGYFEQTPVGRATAVVVPHPSGINRWYNVAENVEKMRAFMRGLEKE